MKTKIFAIVLLTAFATQAQDTKPTPMISVSGEGKIKVIPDKAIINVGIQNTGKNVKEIKTLNDQTVDKVINFIKKFGFQTGDYKTTQVSLNQSYNYETKKQEYKASQTISITLKDLKKYDELISGLVEQGITNISGVEFQSSKIEEHKTEARKQAVVDAKKRAEDYVSVLGQKVGKALAISESSYMMHPPVYKAMAMDASMPESSNRETLAIGEIEITANVSVSFFLE